MYHSVFKTAIILFSILQFTQPWSLKCFCGIEDYETVDLNNTAGFVETSKCFNVSRQTFIYSFGYTGSMENNGTQMVLKTYLFFNDSNVCLVDWTEEANPGFHLIGYPIAAHSALTIGDAVGDAIANLFKAGMRLVNLLLVGLSLGAHLMGEAGRKVFNVTGQKVGRITGLDPAKPKFEGLFQIKNRLDKNCALFVDIIHTDPKKYGIEDATGTIDFYVNYGFFLNGTNRQPGCPQGFFMPLSFEDVCSHRRSWELLIESKYYPDAFQASKAANYNEWVANDGASTEVTCIGPKTNINSSGIYYLSTNGQSRYARGSDGLRP